MIIHSINSIEKLFSQEMEYRRLHKICWTYLLDSRRYAYIYAFKIIMIKEKSNSKSYFSKLPRDIICEIYKFLLLKLMAYEWSISSLDFRYREISDILNIENKYENLNQDLTTYIYDLLYCESISNIDYFQFISKVYSKKFEIEYDEYYQLKNNLK
jgi:hypothetical protein